MNLFELTEMSKIYHIVTIEAVAKSMEEKLEVFAVHNPDKEELIKSRHEAIIRLKEAQVFISKLFTEFEKEKSKNVLLKIDNYNAKQTIEVLKKGVEDWEKRYTGLIEFNK